MEDFVNLFISDTASKASAPEVVLCYVVLNICILPLTMFFLLNVAKIQHNLIKVISIVVGIISISLLYGLSGVLISHLFLSTLSYCLLYVRHGRMLIWILSLTFLYLFWNYASLFSTSYQTPIFRFPIPSFLALLMKMISFSCDIHDQSKRLNLPQGNNNWDLLYSISERNLIPNLLDYMSYCYFPGISLFGPYITYKEYQTLFISKSTRNLASRIYNHLYSKAIDIVVLICYMSYRSVNSYLPNWMPDNIPLVIQIRLHQYALDICQEFVVTFSGVYQISSLGLIKPASRFIVSNPYLIEFPRSFIMILLNWDIPCYNFARNYIYSRCHVFGRYFAAFTTITCIPFYLTFKLWNNYIVSLSVYEIDHYLYLASLILFVLVFLSYIESILRGSLSAMLNLCIKARACPHTCEHDNSPVISGFINLSIGTLCFYVFNSLWKLLL